ncbi:hypothetical protein B566_EDAN003532 [Ephemera danica]|nr:hypothetical protein B566_EDAN003532 [Ephemera danica]
MTSPLNTELVSKIFNSMELRSVEEKKPAVSVPVVASKYRSSFVGGKWLGNVSAPGYHYEENPEQKTYWKNEGAVWNNLSCYERAQHIEKIAETLEREGTKICEIESTLYSTSSTKFTSDILPMLIQYVRYYAGWAGLTTSEPFKPKGCIAVDVRWAECPLMEAIWAIAPALAVGNTVNVLTAERFGPHLPAGTINVIITSGISKPPYSALVSEPAIVFAPFQSAKHAGIETAVHSANCISYVEAAVQAFINESILKKKLTMWPLSEVLVEEHLYRDFIQHLKYRVSSLDPASVPQLTPKEQEWFQETKLYSEDANLEVVTKNGTGILILLGGRTPEAANSWEVEIKPRSLAVLPVRSHTEALSIVGSRPRCLTASVWTEEGALAIQVASELKVVTKNGTGILILLGGRTPEAANSWEVEIKPRSLAVLPVRSHTEALSIVGSRPRCLTASVWTEEGALAIQVASELKMGLVWINQHGVVPHPAAGFGNWKLGGSLHFGGKEGLLSFTRCSVCEIPQAKGATSVTVKTRIANKDENQVTPLLGMYWGGETHKSVQTCFILDGKEKPVAQTSLATSKDVDSAVGAATKAWTAWIAKGAQGRVSVLRTLANTLKSQEEVFVSLMTTASSLGEMQAREELQAAVQGKLVGDGKPGSFLVSREALGVVGICGGGAGLTSLSSAMSLVATALVLGNTVVLAAAESNPIPALILAQALLLHAPLPLGVLNVLTWGVEGALAAHPEVSSLWAGPSPVKLTSPSFKRSWRLSETCNPVRCPDQWLIYQATKLKTVAL